jgi:hypothetical protein
MWLRDSLPEDVQGMRVMIYGYETKIDGSDSNQALGDLSTQLREDVKSVITDSYDSHKVVIPSQAAPQN